MAFVNRSSRSIEFAELNTPMKLGPGAYEPTSTGSFRPRHSNAPFLSTSLRDTVDGALEPVFTTPGPGYYHDEKPKQRHSSRDAAFKSKTSRFGDKTRDTPGPGSYVSHEDLTLRTNPVAYAFKDHPERGSSAPSSLMMAGSTNLKWTKVSTAPSIPAQSQSFGYEEGPKGELVRQKPPDVGHTGRTSDHAGPGEYQWKDDLTKPTKRATDFGASASKRNLFKKPAPVPGPGTYEPPIELVTEIQSPQIKGSSAFRSALKRDFEKPKDNLVPGPGAYPLPGSMSKAEFGLPDHLQFFGSTVRRAYEVQEDRTILAPTYLKTPGPGSYNTSNSTAFARTQGSPPEARPGFVSTAPRFKDKRDAELGPGAYIPSDTMFVEESKKKTHGRYGVFGSTSRRFPVKKQEEPVNPGPGAYDPRADTNTALLRKKDARNAIFQSTVPNRSVPPKEKVAVPPPGEYDVRPQWGEKRITNRSDPAFISQDTRFRDDREAVAKPGPGAYVEILRQQNPSPPKHFLSKSERFHATKSLEVPGPGSYALDVPYVKRSYNVTVDDISV